MTMAESESPPITEASLADDTGIARAVITGLRQRELTPGDDFANVPHRGITFTPSGLEKMKAALAPLLDAAAPGPAGPAEKKEAAPPAPADELHTLVVVHPSLNGGRTCLCRRDVAGEPPRRAYVEVPGDRRKATTLSRGLVLTGCRRSYPANDEIYTYAGPVPARLGQPLPEKKEAAL